MCLKHHCEVLHCLLFGVERRVRLGGGRVPERMSQRVGVGAAWVKRRALGHETVATLRRCLQFVQFRQLFAETVILKQAYERAEFPVALFRVSVWRVPLCLIFRIHSLSVASFPFLPRE